MMKDSIFLKDDFLYHGKLEKFNTEVLDEIILKPENKIHIKNIKLVMLDSKRKKLTLKLEKHKEVVLNLKDEQNTRDFINSLVTAYPNSIFLSSDSVQIQLIKKPLWALLVIIVLLIIISFIDPNHPIRSNQIKSEGIMTLLYGFASLDKTKLLLIFGTLFLIPCLGIFIKLRHSKKTRILKIVR